LASTINASTSAGVITTADTSGILQLQTAGTTALSIDASQNVSFTNQPTYSGGTANGVAYLNGSKVLTTGSALVFDGTNLGVGVTPSAWTSIKALQIVNASFGGLGGGNYSAANAYYDGTNWKYITSNYATLYQQSGNAGDGTHKWNIAASGTAGNAITFTQAMTLDASGNLGVGVTSMNASIHVQGSATTDGSISFNSQFASTTAYNSSPASGSMVALKYTSGGSYAGMGGWSIGKENATDGNYSSYFAMHTRANGGAITERARIDSSGNLLVGTTTVANSSVATFYKTATASNQRVATFINNGTSGSTTAAGIIISYPNASSGNGSTFIQCSDSNTDRFYVLGSGNVQNTNNSYGAISDIKLKENIVDATPKLEKLNQVRVVNYNLIGETQKQIGVIAQELEQIFPGMVEESPDRDEEGNDLGTTTKSVKYSVFVPMLIKAIQEQQALITQLQADVAALKGASS